MTISEGKFPTEVNGQPVKDVDDLRHAGGTAADISIETYHDTDETPELSLLDQFKALSATNRIEEIEANLGKDSYVIPEMALDGQITVFYAKPNTGKTLLFQTFIIRGIEDGTIEADKVFYINADDSYKGLASKLRTAKKWGYHMISPSEAGVRPAEVIGMLEALSGRGDTKGMIIFIDTLKKFVNMMDKPALSDFFYVLRKIGDTNATVIIAGHANKNLDPEGKLIYEGTADLLNDIDCAYAMYRISEPRDGVQRVRFEREKERGDCIEEVTYEYTKIPGMSYNEIRDSVRRIDDAKAKEITKEADEQALMDRHEALIFFVNDQLASGKKNVTQLKDARKANEDFADEVTEKGMVKGLAELTDLSWDMKRNLAGGNAKEYYLKGTIGDDYRHAKGK